MLDIEFKRRKDVEQLTERLKNDKVKIVAGLRRAGKSYLLNPLFKRCLIEEQGYVEENFAIMDFSKQDEITTEEGLKSYLNGLLKRENLRMIFLDEPQETGARFAEVILKFHHMHPSFQIFITGSNSKTLSEDIVKFFGDDGDPLFIEALSYREIKETLPEFTLEDYFRFGGLPVVLREENSEKRLSALAALKKSLYFTDIKMRLEKSMKLKKLSPSEAESILCDLCANLTSPVSVASLARRHLEKGRGSSALDKNAFCLDCLSIVEEAENAYLLFRYLYPLNAEGERNPNAWMSHQIKYYCYDIGLLREIACSNEGRGNVLENAVFLELHRRKIRALPFIRFNEKGREEANVDFSFTYKDRRVLLQVTYEINLLDEEREVKRFAEIEGDYDKYIVYVDNMIGEEDERVGYIQAEKFFQEFL